MAADDHKNEIDQTTGTETTGHEWDGIKELNTPLPRWWLWLFYATVIFAVIYMIFFPSIPLWNQATPGLLGYSSRQNVEQTMAAVAESREGINQEIAESSFPEIQANATLFDFAQRGGAAAFKLHCVQCHGSGAQGSQELGYPNLNDDAWLWGGTLGDIYTTISHGVRNDTHPDARFSEMPAYGEMGMLTRAQISDVADYVLSLSGRDHDAEGAARGEEIYTTQCAACHGADGSGNTELGAPRLNDALWLYGGGHDAIMAQVYKPRMGVMPPWDPYFDDATRKKLAIYVHTLGGGQ